MPFWIRIYVLGVTPLHSAARRNHLQVVTILLDNGADANAVDVIGEYK